MKPGCGSKLWRAGAIGLMLLALASGCQKSAEQTAEEKALARHEQEVRQRKALRAFVKNPKSIETLLAAGFLKSLDDNRQLPGVTTNDHELLGLEMKQPLVAPKGPYYWSEEFHFTIKDSPPRHWHYLVVRTYSNSDFQLDKAWRSDGRGKVLEETPMSSAPAMTNGIFLGPANPGAELRWSSWGAGAIGEATVSIDSGEPATGLNCFSLRNTASPSAAHHADIHGGPFPLGDAAKAHQPIQFTFAYKLPNKVKPGDNIELFFRFFDETGTNFLDQKVLFLGAKTADSEMTQYKRLSLTNVFAPAKAATADIWITANAFDAPWTSGTALFDDFAVTTTPQAVPARSWGKLCVGLSAALSGLVICGFYLSRRKRQSLTLTRRVGFPACQ